MVDSNYLGEMKKSLDMESEIMKAMKRLANSSWYHRTKLSVFTRPTDKYTSPLFKLASFILTSSNFSLENIAA